MLKMMRRQSTIALALSAALVSACAAILGIEDGSGSLGDGGAGSDGAAGDGGNGGDGAGDGGTGIFTFSPCGEAAAGTPCLIYETTDSFLAWTACEDIVYVSTKPVDAPPKLLRMSADGNGQRIIDISREGPKVLACSRHVTQTTDLLAWSRESPTPDVAIFEIDDVLPTNPDPIIINPTPPIASLAFDRMRLVTATPLPPGGFEIGFYPFLLPADGGGIEAGISPATQVVSNHLHHVHADAHEGWVAALSSHTDGGIGTIHLWQPSNTGAADVTEPTSGEAHVAAGIAHTSNPDGGTFTWATGFNSGDSLEQITKTTLTPTALAAVNPLPNEAVALATPEPRPDGSRLYVVAIRSGTGSDLYVLTWTPTGPTTQNPLAHLPAHDVEMHVVDGGVLVGMRVEDPGHGDAYVGFGILIVPLDQL